MVGLAADINDLHAQTKKSWPTCWSSVEATGCPHMLQTAAIESLTLSAAGHGLSLGGVWVQSSDRASCPSHCSLAQSLTVSQETTDSPSCRLHSSSVWNPGAHLKGNVLSLAITVQP